MARCPSSSGRRRRCGRGGGVGAPWRECPNPSPLTAARLQGSRSRGPVGGEGGEMVVVGGSGGNAWAKEMTLRRRMSNMYLFLGRWRDLAASSRRVLLLDGILGEDGGAVGTEVRSYSYDRSRERIHDEADDLPPEKQVEVAYEETRTIPSKRSMQRGQNNGTNARVKESRGSSDMSMSSSLENSTARHSSRSNSPFIPTEQPSDYMTGHRDSNMKYHAKEPHVSAFNSATTYQGSYLANSDGHKDALGERNDPALYTGADDRSSAYNSSIEEMTKMYAPARAGDVYSPQGQGNGGSLYGRQDDHLQTNLYSLGSSGARYDQIGSSGARYGQSSLTSPSYGLLSTTQAWSSVMDKYGPGLGSGGSGPSVMNNYAPGYLGANAPRSSAMDRHAPPLDQTNHTVRGVHDVPGYGRDVPPQHPYRGPHPSGRGPPHI